MSCLLRHRRDLYPLGAVTRFRPGAQCAALRATGRAVVNGEPGLPCSTFGRQGPLSRIRPVDDGVAGRAGEAELTSLIPPL